MLKQKELQSLQRTQQHNHNRNENVNRVISHDDEYSGKSLPNETDVSTGRLSVVYYIIVGLFYILHFR